jgi:tetratricopeptide (TPR) repeat protein
LCLYQKGQFPEAVKEYQQLIDIQSSSDLKNISLPDIYEKNGIEGFLEFITDLELKNPGQSLRYLATFYSMSGNREKALDYLEENVKNYTTEYQYLGVEPVYKNLRSEPRFLALVKKIGY